MDVIENADGGPTPQELAAIIVDEASGVTVVASSANTTINASGFPSSDPNAFGSFTNGITAAGTLLPAANQNASGTATYTGGIGINSGVCLCTGALQDEPDTPTTGRGSGVLGPNNGKDNFGGLNQGEIVTVLDTPVDQDFEDLVFPISNPGGGDATVLVFQVQISSPGFLRVSFVFGSDEHDAWDQGGFGVNDSVGIIVGGLHIDPENIATITVNGVTTPFDLFEFKDCGPPLFIENDVAPSPAELVGSAHAIPGAPFYDIEFGGFTKRLTREISRPLAPGIYTIKFVVQDVVDRWVDAGVFIEENSLKLFPLVHGDYNGDGIVDVDDYQLWKSHFGMTSATFYDGDGNGNGVVDSADFTVWRDHLGQSGNRDLRSDFDRDGEVGFTDFVIFDEFYPLEHCASRFEGDVDGDGDLDIDDWIIFISEFGSGSSAAATGDQSAAAQIETYLNQQGVSLDTDRQRELKEQLVRGSDQISRVATSVFGPIVRSLLPDSPDADGDGDVDADDLAIIDGILGLTDQ
jgi:hypothetical protein